MITAREARAIAAMCSPAKDKDAWETTPNDALITKAVICAAMHGLDGATVRLNTELGEELEEGLQSAGFTVRRKQYTGGHYIRVKWGRKEEEDG